MEEPLAPGGCSEPRAKGSWLGSESSLRIPGLLAETKGRQAVVNGLISTPNNCYSPRGTRDGNPL